jgi:rSAM/selenodomain-associated transferase 1
MLSAETSREGDPRVKRPTVYVVAKAPEVGACKTRLCPPLAPRQTVALAQAFLLDTLHTVARAGLEPRLICRDQIEQRALRALVGEAVRVSAQPGAGLGDALESAFREGLDEADQMVAVLGADSPTLPPEILQAAAAAVLEADVALGPSEDGGYYLLAASAAYPALFRGMPWSTSLVASETLRRCRALGLTSQCLSTWYDVDDAAALARLRTDLAGLPASIAPRTREHLAHAAHAEPVER